MDTKIDEWGNSLAVRIPKSIVRNARLRKGTQVTVKAVDEGILISKAEPRRSRHVRKYSLAELLARCKGPNPYKFISGGRPVGKEVF